MARKKKEQNIIPLLVSHKGETLVKTPNGVRIIDLRGYESGRKYSLTISANPNEHTWKTLHDCAKKIQEDFKEHGIEALVFVNTDDVQFKVSEIEDKEEAPVVEDSSEDKEQVTTIQPEVAAEMSEESKELLKEIKEKYAEQWEREFTTDGEVSLELEEEKQPYATAGDELENIQPLEEQDNKNSEEVE